MAKKKANKKDSIPKISGKDLIEVSKLLEKHNFASIEEAIEFVQQLADLTFPDDELDELIEDEDLSDLGEAQDLIFDAWETDDRKERIDLAKKALTINPDSADAYNVLAGESETLGEMKELFLKGIEAGKRSIGEENFKEMSGAFWGFHETRPYMRAMEGLSDVLWMLNDKNESINVIKRMLVLNPNDNQGMRYALINKLLFLRKYKEAEDLLEEYSDDYSASWLYSKAYLYFNKPSKRIMADKLLIEAMEFNPFVPLYLFGLKDMPKSLPEFIGLGDENEAIEYVSQSFEMWSVNGKAQEWISSLHIKNLDKLESIIIEKEKAAEERFKKLKRQ
jgi:tetratricopeptide (TPR) repeat protein